MADQETEAEQGQALEPIQLPATATMTLRWTVLRLREIAVTKYTLAKKLILRGAFFKKSTCEDRL